MMDWPFVRELGFWALVLDLPIIVYVVLAQRASRVDEARRRQRERSL